MDHVTPRRFPGDWEALASEAGIPPNDPLWPILRAMADHAARADAALARIEAMPPSLDMTPEQVNIIARVVGRSTDQHVRQFADASKTRSWALAAAAILVSSAIGYGVCWKTTPNLPELTCGNLDTQQSGTRLRGTACWYWTVLPTEDQASPSPATPAATPHATKGGH
jgi:hypothetical protein